MIFCFSMRIKPATKRDGEKLMNGSTLNFTTRNRASCVKAGSILYDRRLMHISISAAVSVSRPSDRNTVILSLQVS